MESLLIFLENYGIGIFLLALAVISLLVYHIRNNRPSLTGPATVVSHRVEPAKFSAGGYFAKTNNWNYYVKFRLSGGEEKELYVSGEEYSRISEGQQGQLTWNGDSLVAFLTD